MYILLLEITHYIYYFLLINEYHSIIFRTISFDAYYGAKMKSTKIVEQGVQRYVSGGVDQFWENR